MQLDSAYADLKKWTEDTNIWCEQGEPCVVGDLYNEQSRPFYRPKTALGSPKETFSDIPENKGNIFSLLLTFLHCPYCESTKIINEEDKHAFLCPIFKNI